MSYKEIIEAVLKLCVLFFGIYADKNSVTRQKKQEAFDKVKEGLKEQDPSKITAGFDLLR